MKIRRIRFRVVLLLGLASVGYSVVKFESNFKNPNDGVEIPFGIWKVEDLRAVANEGKSQNASVKLVYNEVAELAQVDVLHDDIFQLVFSSIETFSAFTNETTEHRFIFAHDGDFFSKWDDIYKNGAVGALIGTDRDTKQKVFYKLIIFSPDFDTQALEISYSVRNQLSTEHSTDLVSQIPNGFLQKSLVINGSVDLINATLIVGPIEIPELEN